MSLNEPSDIRNDANLRHFSSRANRENTYRNVQMGPRPNYTMFDDENFGRQVMCDHWMHVGVSPSYNNGSAERYRRTLHMSMQGDNNGR